MNLGDAAHGWPRKLNRHHPRVAEERGSSNIRWASVSGALRQRTIGEAQGMARSRWWDSTGDFAGMENLFEQKGGPNHGSLNL